MKICALTMVYRDYWALSQWYAHYSRHLGPQNLFVVAHGADPKIHELCPGASIITVPRDKFTEFDLFRGRLLNGFQAGLNEGYDWVIRTDVDELICLDPARYQSYAELFEQHPGRAQFSLGLNLAELPGDPELKPGMLALQHRQRALFSAHYSKAWAVRQRVGLRRHGIEIRPRHTEAYPFSVPRGVYLVHLKYANANALAESDAHRMQVASEPGHGTPGQSWLKPDLRNRKFAERVRSLPLTNWDEAEPQAYAQISGEPERDRRIGVIRVRDVPLNLATDLPGWFRSA
ncbi:glycosyltransferase family 2 protein [Ruegeria sp. 2205SS24-7]|uniref:glycosyltransferase family 2 protein n=1 Tax=Ruegeria discodermiae TaxID=3064389 RepID=UPI002741D300|nr:glycosyltransferase family 2 protein [Ruegeria sp. 2205SS24-7]MDP5220299.1 glycosyltransferase family 2 protein [Ruegeria sp. 2205SS24-7]